jgi:hypothetical protein
MNVSSGATVELVRKAIGEILPLPLLEHGSVVCPSSLISDSLKTCEIFTIKKNIRTESKSYAENWFFRTYE